MQIVMAREGYTEVFAFQTDLRHEVQASLSLLLLQLEGNAANGASSNSLHQVSDETSNLVSHSLGRNDGNLGSHSLVGVEVQSQTRIVLLDDNSGGLLDGLGSDSLLDRK